MNMAGKPAMFMIGILQFGYAGFFNETSAPVDGKHLGLFAATCPYFNF